MSHSSTRNIRTSLLLSTALGLLISLSPMPAFAQQYWDGTDTTSGNGVPIGGAGGAAIWDATTTNWTDDVAGTNNEAWSGGDAVFDNTGSFIELDGNQAVGDMTFSVSGYHIGDAGGVAGDLVLNAGTSLISLSAITTISANISGAGALSTAGSSSLILSGNNSFSGGVNLAAGAIALRHDNAAGTGTITSGNGSISLDSGLDVSNNMLSTFPFSINTVQNGGSATLSGNISGTGVFSKTGTGEIILSGTNNYSGATLIQNGTLTAQGGAAIGDLSAVSFSFSGSDDILKIVSSETIGSLAGVGIVTIAAGQTLTAGGNNTSSTYSGVMTTLTGTFEKAGTGNMTFSGDNNDLGVFNVLDGTATLTGSDFDAYIFVSDGARLVANNTSGNAISDPSTVDVSGTGVFEVQTDETIGNLNGSGNVFLNGGDLTFGTFFDRTSSGVLSGAGGVIKQGTGTQTFSGINTYAGVTTVNGGTLSVTGSIVSTSLDVNNDGTLRADDAALTSGAVIDLSGTATFFLNGDNTIASIVSVAGTTIDLDDGDLTTGNAGDQTIAGVIVGTNDLIKQGTGILALSGNNTYSGGTTVAGGTLSLQHDNAAGTGTITTTGSVIDYANGVTTLNPININSNTTQLQVLVGSAEQSGNISETAGPRPLEKIGAGALTLSGTNTYTGLTTISAGTLLLNGGAAISDAGSVFVGSTGTFTLLASETIAAMNNAGVINLQNGAVGETLTLVGDYTGAGVLNIDVNFGADTADTLVVGGNVVASTTSVAVNDVSTGAATGNDVLVVDVAGTSSAGDFVLAGGNITSGAFTYALGQVGVDWFLQQALSPLTATYEVYPQTLSALNSVSSLRQRTGSRVYTEGDENLGNIWGLIEASHALVSPQSSTTSSTFETNVWKIRAGVDGVIHADENGEMLLGLNASFGTAAVDIFSSTGNGSIFTQGLGLGLTGTWFGADGFYVDGQLQVGWNFSDLTSATAGALVTDNFGQSYALSLEAGKNIDLGNGLVLTPNAQLSYSIVQFTGFSGPAGETVSLDYADSLVARVGVLVEQQQEWQAVDGTSTSSSVYGLANVYSDFSGVSQVDVSGTKLSTQPYRLSGEVGLGGSYNWGDGKYLLTGEVAVSSSLENFGTSYEIRGSLGYRAHF